MNVSLPVDILNISACAKKSLSGSQDSSMLHCFDFLSLLAQQHISWMEQKDAQAASDGVIWCMTVELVGLVLLSFVITKLSFTTFRCENPIENLTHKNTTEISTMVFKFVRFLLRGL